MNKRYTLQPVTGNAQFCGPCALSAVTGKSSEAWPDGDMTPSALQEALDAAGIEYSDLAVVQHHEKALHIGDSFVKNSLVQNFCSTSEAWTDDWNVIDPVGLWLLLVDLPNAYHWIAVGINYEKERRLADNEHRKPRTFAEIGYTSRLLTASIEMVFRLE